MLQKSASRVTKPDLGCDLLENGDHMDQKTFHELYKQTPEGFRAELIRGVVFVASPTRLRHSRPHGRVSMWAFQYAEETPGIDGGIGTTTILGEETEVEPDIGLFIDPEFGGRVTVDNDGYIQGPPEVAIEVANTSATIDLNTKRLEYEAAGVREYIVFLVKLKEVRWFTRGKASFAPLPPVDGIYSSRVFPGLWLDPVAVFEKHSPKLTETLRAGLATPEHAAFVAKLAKQAAKRTKGDKA